MEGLIMHRARNSGADGLAKEKTYNIIPRKDMSL